MSLEHCLSWQRKWNFLKAQGHCSHTSHCSVFSSDYSCSNQLMSLYLALNSLSAGEHAKATALPNWAQSHAVQVHIQVKHIYLPCLDYYVLQQFLERRNRHSFHILWHEESVALKEKSKTNWFLKDNSVSLRPRLLGMTDRSHTATL